MDWLQELAQSSLPYILALLQMAKALDSAKDQAEAELDSHTSEEARQHVEQACHELCAQAQVPKILLLEVTC